MGLAIATEGLQQFADRDFEFRDLLFNGFGIALALSGFFVFGSMFVNGLRRKSRYFLRGLYSVILLTILLTLFMRWGWLASYEFWYRCQLPTFASFERKLDLITLEKNPGTELDVRPLHATHGTKSLEVVCQPENYPGVNLEYVPENWTGFGEFAFDVYNPDSSDLLLNLRIDSRNDSGGTGPRFIARVSLHPGQNRISIPVAELKINRPGEMLNLHRIRRIIFFVSRPLKTVRFYLDNVRLLI